MPELPEVEITRQGIAPFANGSQIVQLRMGKPLRWPLGIAPQALKGRRIRAVQRRGKYLLLPLEDAVRECHAGEGMNTSTPVAIRVNNALAMHDGSLNTADKAACGADVEVWGDVSSHTDAHTVLAVAKASSPTPAQLQQMLDKGVLLIHLGMSGRLRCASSPYDLPRAGAHDHMELRTTRGVLRLTDPRRFGAVVYADAQHQRALAQRLLDGLGVEPLDAQQFTLTYFCDALARRHAAIKQVLLGGDVVVGVGNIYAAESLFMARIHPETSASQLRPAQVRRLWQAVVQTLQQAIVQGGSTLKDFAHADGSSGYFQLQAAVYGRAGQPCIVCATPIAHIKQGQRSTYFCPRCQKSR